MSVFLKKLRLNKSYRCYQIIRGVFCVNRIRMIKYTACLRVFGENKVILHRSNPIIQILLKNNSNLVYCDISCEYILAPFTRLIEVIKKDNEDSLIRYSKLLHDGCEKKKETVDLNDDIAIAFKQRYKKLFIQQERR